MTKKNKFLLSIIQIYIKKRIFYLSNFIIIRNKKNNNRTYKI